MRWRARSRGVEAKLPYYRITVSVPEGQFDDERRAAMVKEVTETVLDAEEGRYPRDSRRVWVFATEVPDGTWGGGGKIFRLQDIAAMVSGDPEKARSYAERRIAMSRKSREPATVG
jgi:phenylpyruvate tautomerase PptA (4-oxalocrotonate tautomerase family)